jgi:hypothetical protein
MHDALRTHKLSTLTKGVNSGRCVMVKEILEALQNTPIPFILVVAGIGFLLLSIAGQLTGGMAMRPERQRQAMIIGDLLLVVSVALSIGLALGQGIETKYAGVMARITGFGTSGAFITLEITVKNGWKKGVVCGFSKRAQLFDQETGDSWEPVSTGGDISTCRHLDPSVEGRTWMQFKIPNPEARVFSLKHDLFNRPVENLVLEKPP